MDFAYHRSTADRRRCRVLKDGHRDRHPRCSRRSAVISTPSTWTRCTRPVRPSGACGPRPADARTLRLDPRHAPPLPGLGTVAVSNHIDYRRPVYIGDTITRASRSPSSIRSAIAPRWPSPGPTRTTRWSLRARRSSSPRVRPSLEADGAPGCHPRRGLLPLFRPDPVSDEVLARLFDRCGDSHHRAETASRSAGSSCAIAR